MIIPNLFYCKQEKMAGLGGGNWDYKVRSAPPIKTTNEMIVNK